MTLEFGTVLLVATYTLLVPVLYRIRIKNIWLQLWQSRPPTKLLLNIALWWAHAVDTLATRSPKKQHSTVLSLGIIVNPCKIELYWVCTCTEWIMWHVPLFPVWRHYTHICGAWQLHRGIPSWVQSTYLQGSPTVYTVRIQIEASLHVLVGADYVTEHNFSLSKSSFFFPLSSPFMSDVQVCHQRHSSALDLLLIFLSFIPSLSPPLHPQSSMQAGLHWPCGGKPGRRSDELCCWCLHKVTAVPPVLVHWR